MRTLFVSALFSGAGGSWAWLPAVLIVLVLAALITPSDPVSMFVLALPLYLLYEGSILICKS